MKFYNLARQADRLFGLKVLFPWNMNCLKAFQKTQFYCYGKLRS